MPEEIIELTAGSEFVVAADALRLLAPYLALLAMSGLLVRVVGASHRDRFLLGLTLVVLTLNVALNLVLLPVYGYEVAALVSVLSEAIVVAGAGWLVWTTLGFLPLSRYILSIAAAGLLMALVFVVLPGNRYVAGVVSVIAYAAMLVAVPGTVRRVVQSLLPGNRAEARP
jgi:O-antigen/teichoic acid export membrane protein